MPGITLAQAEGQLAYWLGLNLQLGPNQEVTIDNTTVKRADVLKQVVHWNREVNRLSRTAGMLVREVIPR